jgi:hypothetical protein
MDEQSQADKPKAQATTRRDRWIKLGFVAVTLAAVVYIYYRQRGGLSIPGWGTDLDAALQKASQEGREVLVLFVSDPPGEIAQQLAKATVPMNAKAIKDGRYVAVVVTVDTALQSETARFYKLKTLPTLLLVGPEGLERNRREGMVGELEFRRGFLDCAEIVRPTP